MCCAHLLAGEKEVLADVGQPSCLRFVGVIREERDPGGQRRLHGLVERGRGDQGTRDAVGLARYGAVDRVDHLADVARRRTRPRVRAAEQLARVGRAVLGRREEDVGGDVVDQDVVLALVERQRSRTRCCCWRARLVGASARFKRERGYPRGASRQRGPPRDLVPLLGGGFLLLALVPLEALNRVTQDVVL